MCMCNVIRFPFLMFRPSRSRLVYTMCVTKATKFKVFEMQTNYLKQLAVRIATEEKKVPSNYPEHHSICIKKQFFRMQIIYTFFFLRTSSFFLFLFQSRSLSANCAPNNNNNFEMLHFFHYSIFNLTMCFCVFLSLLRNEGKGKNFYRKICQFYARDPRKRT